MTLKHKEMMKEEIVGASLSLKVFPGGGRDHSFSKSLSSSSSHRRNYWNLGTREMDYFLVCVCDLSMIFILSDERVQMMITLPQSAKNAKVRTHEGTGTSY